MRIGIDARELERGNLTGVGRYLLNFLKHISGSEAKHKFIIFCNQKSYIPVSAPNIRKRVIYEYLTLWWDQVSLPLALNKENIDIFFSPYFKAPLLTKKKMIITINDLYFLTSHFMKGLNKFRLFKILAKLTAKKADKVITVSNYSGDEIMRTFGTSKNKIRVIYNGIDEKFKPQEDKQIIKTIKQKYTNGEDYLLFVGNFFPTKNTEGLIRAYGRLSIELRSKFKLLIIAKKDAYYNKISALIKNLSLKHRINIIEFVDDVELPAIYSGADLVIVPSFYEGFGFPVVEAMACGTPVLASNAASIPEVASDAALLVNPYSVEELKNGIERLICNEDLRIELAEKGLKRAEKFNAKIFAEQIMKLIEDVASEKNLC